MSDGDIALWVTLWLVGAAVCIGLFVWTRKYLAIDGGHRRVRPFILLGVIPCWGLNVVFGLGAFAIFMAQAVSASRQPPAARPSPGPTPPREAQQFGRQASAGALLPPGTTERIIAYAKNSYYHDQEYSDWMLEPDMYAIAQVDRNRFLDEMVHLAGNGGWLALGCERLTLSLLGADRSDPRYAQLLEAACQFLRENGVTKFHITGHESHYWGGRDPYEVWLEARPLPNRDTWVPTPMGTDEPRTIVRLDARPESNYFVVVHDAAGFVGMNNVRWSDEDPRRVQDELARRDSLYDLYVELGEKVVTYPAWVADDFEPFVPFGPSKL